MLSTPRVAYFTPLNPVQSGISDYSEDLLPWLEADLDLTLVVDGYAPTNAEVTGRFRVVAEAEYERQRAAHAFDGCLYHMGNSPAHAYILRQHQRHPGVVVLHDYVLHHLRIWMAINLGGQRQYLEDMARAYGEEGRVLAARILRGLLSEELFRYPLSEDVIRGAPALMVHSRHVEGLVRRVWPDAPVCRFPMGIPPVPSVPSAAARERLGIDADAFVIASFGHLNPYKRTDASLRALRGLLSDVPRALYLLVGSASPNYDAASRVRLLGLEDRVRMVGYADPAAFRDYVAAADVCLNLRHPTAGETSASLLRLMAAGKATIVSDTGWFRELPAGTCARVDVDELEDEVLLDTLRLLARDSEVRREMEERAARYVREQHAMELAAGAYRRFLPAVLGGEDLSPWKGGEDAAVMPNDAEEPSDLSPADGPLPLADLVAPALVELGITEEDEELLREVAEALAELGLMGGRR